jgi:hypothetical protein
MINPSEIHKRLSLLGEAWAESNYEASLLEETRKTVLAGLMSKLEGSQALKEQGALANPSYREHIENMCVARRDADIAKVKYDSARMYAELMRTQAATERAANKYAT